MHLASNPLRANRTDVQGTARMLEIARSAGARHVLFVSIVGCDLVPFPYYRAKAATEREVLGGPVPGTVLRATQFHDFVPLLVSMLGRGPVMLLPTRFRSQLVDVRDVADRLAGLVEAGPTGRARDLAGPELVDLRQAVARWAEAAGRRAPRIIAIPRMFGAVRALAGGANLAGPDADRGERTFSDWLTEQRAGRPDAGRR